MSRYSESAACRQELERVWPGGLRSRDIAQRLGIADVEKVTRALCRLNTYGEVFSERIPGEQAALLWRVRTIAISNSFVIKPKSTGSVT